MTDLRFPIGKAQFETEMTDARRAELISQIESAPVALREAVRWLSEEQLETPYRPDGWTLRQVVHHLPDSHMNSYTRFKLALTEDSPTIRPYDEAAWAEMPEARTAPLSLSLDLLEALHGRWALMLRSMTPADFARSFNHPEIGQVSLDQALSLYAWHGRHHVAHITSLRRRMGWD
jgi:uncharacterized damage-inducible protein DinB